MLRSLAFACLMLALAALDSPCAAAEQTPLRFGVFPRWNAQIMVSNFNPLARALGTVLGREVHVESAKDFDAFMQRVYAHEFDIVHLNQLQYLQAHDKAGYTAIAKLCEQPECTIRAIIVTRTDTGIARVEDLRGKTIAFGDRNAMVSYLLGQDILREQGLPASAYQTVFTKNPPNALLSVYNQAAAAAGVGSTVMQRQEITRRIDTGKLRVLAESRPIPPLPIAVRADLDPILVQHLVTALQALQNDAAGLAILKRVGATHIMPASDGEYAGLQDLSDRDAHAKP